MTSSLRQHSPVFDTEDASDVVVQIYAAFGLTEEPGELQHIRTLGELCDHIQSRITGEDSVSCTSQQAFYKLRRALQKTTTYSQPLTPATELKAIFPRKGRRQAVRQLEDALGFPLSILAADPALRLFFGLCFIGGFVLLFFQVFPGISLCMLSAFALWLCKATTRRLNVHTLGELTKRLATHQYARVRSHPLTVNRKEVEAVIFAHFKEFGAKPHELVRELRFEEYRPF